MILEQPIKTEESVGTPVRQFTIMLSNKSGALSSLLTSMSKLGIFCVGINLIDTQEVSLTRMIVSNPEMTYALFFEKGIGFSTTDMIVVELPYGAAKLRHCLDALARNNINIDYLYPLFPVPKGSPMMALHVDEKEQAKAHQVLLAAGFRTLCQEDISR